MENFTNTTIDISQLPRFETVAFQKLQPDYWKVIVINQVTVFLVLVAVYGILQYLVEEVPEQSYLFCYSIRSAIHSNAYIFSNCFS